MHLVKYIANNALKFICSLKLYLFSNLVLDILSRIFFIQKNPKDFVYEIGVLLKARPLLNDHLLVLSNRNWLRRLFPSMMSLIKFITMRHLNCVNSSDSNSNHFFVLINLERSCRLLSQLTGKPALASRSLSCGVRFYWYWSWVSKILVPVTWPGFHIRSTACLHYRPKRPWPLII